MLCYRCSSWNYFTNQFKEITITRFVFETFSQINSKKSQLQGSFLKLFHKSIQRNHNYKVRSWNFFTNQFKEITRYKITHLRCTLPLLALDVDSTFVVLDLHICCLRYRTTLSFVMCAFLKNSHLKMYFLFLFFYYLKS